MLLCRCPDGSYVVGARRLGAPRWRRGYVLRLRPGGLVAALPMSSWRPPRGARGRQAERRRRATLGLLALGAAELVTLAFEALAGRLGLATGFAVAAAAGLAGAMSGLYHTVKGPCDELAGWACSEPVEWRRPSSVEGPYGKRGLLATLYVLRVGLGDAVYEVLLHERQLRELEGSGALPR